LPVKLVGVAEEVVALFVGLFGTVPPLPPPPVLPDSEPVSPGGFEGGFWDGEVIVKAIWPLLAKAPEEDSPKLSVAYTRQ
jgi:hypothetical protein